MSLMDNGSNGMVMPVSPMYGGGGYGNCRPSGVAVVQRKEG